MFENLKDEKNGELKNTDSLKHFYQTITTSLGFVFKKITKTKYCIIRYRNY